MAKTTTVTTSYTSDIVVNGTAISADKIYANGTQVRRCIVNGTDVIHKFTRTVVTAKSNLTFTFTVRFTMIRYGAAGNMLYFKSPIYVDVTVTDNGSSGFKAVTLATPLLTFYCEAGNQGNSGSRYYQQELLNQSLTIGQTTTLTFSYFQNKDIYASIPDDQATHYELSFLVEDPDGIVSSSHLYSENNISDSSLTNYSQTTTYPRAVEEILSDNTVQEY